VCGVTALAPLVDCGAQDVAQLVTHDPPVRTRSTFRRHVPVADIGVHLGAVLVA
jgi:hypothetical protein